MSDETKEIRVQDIQPPEEDADPAEHATGALDNSSLSQGLVKIGQEDPHAALEQLAASEKPAVNVELREATIDDLDVLLHGHEQAKIASIGSGFDDAEKAKWSDEYKRRLEDPKYDISVIMDGDSSIGMAVYDMQPDPMQLSESTVDALTQEPDGEKIVDVLKNRAGVRAHLSITSVDEEYRGRGIGSAVTGQMEDKFRGKGVKAVSFETGKNNARMQKAAKGYRFVEESTPGLGYTEPRVIGVKMLNEPTVSAAA